MIIAVRANSVRDGCSLARSHLGLRLRETRERIRSGGEDGLWRVTLNGGTVVEVSTVSHAHAEVLAVEP